MLLLSISIFIAVYRLKNEQTTEKENENHMPEKEWKMKREKEKQIKVTHIWLNIFVEMTIWFRCYYHKRTLHIFSKWYTYIHLARVKEKKEAPKHTNYSKNLAAVTATKVNTWHWIWIHIHIIINIRRAHRFEMKNGRNCKVISRILYSKWQNTRKERERETANNLMLYELPTYIHMTHTGRYSNYIAASQSKLFVCLFFLSSSRRCFLCVCQIHCQWCFQRFEKRVPLFISPFRLQHYRCYMQRMLVRARYILLSVYCHLHSRTAICNHKTMVI